MSVTFRVLLLAFSVCFTSTVRAQDDPKPVGDPKAQTEPDTKTEPAKKTDEKKPGETKPDEKKPDEKKADEPKEKKVDPGVKFKALSKRKLELFNTLKKLEKDFTKAESNAQKIEIRDAFEDAVREFNVDIYPEMVDLAPKVYLADPTNLDAAEMVLQDAFNNNQYEKTNKIAQELLKADRRTRGVLNAGGVAAYAIHDFESARKLLTDAKERRMIIDRYSVYIDYAEEYKAFWKEEQEIRKREAELKGNLALPRVEFKTNKGKIVLELFEDDAPNTVANFVSLVEAKKYDGIKFHRVIPNFMCQGGDPNTLDDDPTNDGLGGPGYKIKCECFDEDRTVRRHFRGTLSMAHAGKDTGGSQFFITHLPTAWLNPKQESQSGHTVFGRVVEGLDIVDTIAKGDTIEEAKVLNKRAHEYKPVKVGDEEKAVEPKEEVKKDEAKKDEVKKDEVKKEADPTKKEAGDPAKK